MPTGLAVGVVQSMLNALCRNVAWTPPAAFYVKLHTGDPGAAGTVAPFGDTTRQLGTFSAADGAGGITTSADLNWTNLSASGTLTHVSFWSAVTAGAFLGSDDLATARPVVAGDNFSILAGQASLSITPVAA